MCCVIMRNLQKVIVFFHKSSIYILWLDKTCSRSPRFCNFFKAGNVCELLATETILQKLSAIVDSLVAKLYEYTSTRLFADLFSLIKGKMRKKTINHKILKKERLCSYIIKLLLRRLIHDYLVFKLLKNDDEVLRFLSLRSFSTRQILPPTRAYYSFLFLLILFVPLRWRCFQSFDEKRMHLI